MFYKYMKKQHALALINLGVVRIGTLFDFRRTEKHGTRMGDADEGKLIYRFPAPPEGITLTADTQTPLIRRLFEFGEGASLTLRNGGFRYRESVGDCYVFCITDRLDRTLAQEFECDTCVWIHSADRFFEALSAIVQARFVGLFRCSYQTRVRDHSRWGHDDVHPALVKDPSYGTQHELRAVWLPLNSPEIHPYKAIAPGVIRCCSLIPF